MDQQPPGRMSRILRAAEAWGQQHFGEQMEAVFSTAPERLKDGTLAATIDLYITPLSPGTVEKAEPAVRITTLERDGSLSFVTKDELTKP